MRADIVPDGTLPDDELTRQIRPDRGPATPGPRERWEAGDHALFQEGKTTDRSASFDFAERTAAALSASGGS